MNRPLELVASAIILASLFAALPSCGDSSSSDPQPDIIVLDVPAGDLSEDGSEDAPGDGTGDGAGDGSADTELVDTEPADAGRDTGEDLPDQAEEVSVTVCLSDDDCSDGVFCNGTEFCLPELTEDPSGCHYGPLPCAASESCDESGATCETNCAVDPDADDDGFDAVACGGQDCNDHDETVFPGAEELIADGVDQDCDGLELCFVDEDGDGYHPGEDAAVTSADHSCSGEGIGAGELLSGDCDDTDPAIKPGAPDEPADGVDQDCDGVELCFIDSDGDGFVVGDGMLMASEDSDCLDEGEADKLAPGGDCDDQNALINPYQPEVPGDGIDQNCDGLEDCYVDADGDGYRPLGGAVVVSPDLSCAEAGEAPASALTGDCADDDPDRHPRSYERCNGLDDTCDGHVDERWIRTGVFLGHYEPLKRPCGSDVGRCELGREECAGGQWSGICLNDVEPLASELCDGTVDDDCDGHVDEGCGCTAGQTRPCGSSTGACQQGVQTCNTAGIWGTCAGGVVATDETCDGSDNDCDGGVDEENAVGCKIYWLDADGDGFAPADADYRCLCAPDGDYQLEECPSYANCPKTPDCNDANAAINPNAQERCDSVDHDCDGAPTEENATGCTNYYADVDGDGYGGSSKCLCAPNSTYRLTQGGDCCDRDARARPFLPPFLWYTAPNVCGSYDYDCNGTAQQAFTRSGYCYPWCENRTGWFGKETVPCGGTHSYISACVFNPGVFFCNPFIVMKTQSCR